MEEGCLNDTRFFAVCVKSQLQSGVPSHCKLRHVLGLLRFKSRKYL